MPTSKNLYERIFYTEFFGLYCQTEKGFVKSLLGYLKYTDRWRYTRMTSLEGKLHCTEYFHSCSTRRLVVERVSTAYSGQMKQTHYGTYGR